MGLKILIADDNENFVEILKQYFLETNRTDKIITAVNGFEAIDAIISNKPDVVIMDLIMPGLDGLGVLRKMKMLGLNDKPIIIVLSAAGRSKIIQMALNMGAEFFMMKPVDLEELILRVDELRMLKNQDDVSLNSTAKTPNIEKSFESKVMDILDALGVPSNLQGYKYLVSAILMLNNDLTLINSVTKNLYSDLAEKWDTTPQRIERSIRNAIETTWLRGNLENISKVFEPDKFPQKIRPSNSEFMIKILMNAGIR